MHFFKDLFVHCTVDSNKTGRLGPPKTFFQIFINNVFKYMIFLISKKASLVPLFKYIWSIFGQYLKKEVKNWRGPLAIKTKKYFAFNTFFFRKAQTRPKKI